MGQTITEKIKKYWRKKKTASRNIGENFTISLIRDLKEFIMRWFKHENS